MIKPAAHMCTVMFHLRAPLVEHAEICDVGLPLAMGIFVLMKISMRLMKPVS